MNKNVMNGNIEVVYEAVLPIPSKLSQQFSCLVSLVFAYHQLRWMHAEATVRKMFTFEIVRKTSRIQQ